MPAYFDSGFVVEKAAWHKMATVLTRADADLLDSNKACKEAGANYTVALQQLYLPKPTQELYNADMQKINVQEIGQPSNAMSIIRTDTNTELGVATSQYQPWQNQELFDFVDQFRDKARGVGWESAGVLCDGKKAWALLTLGEMNVAPSGGKEDIVKKYLLANTSHDGTSCIRVGFTPVRVVCANTLQASVKHPDSALVRVRHRAKLHLTLEQVANSIDLAHRCFNTTQDVYKEMAKNCVIPQADLQKYFNLVLDESTPGNKQVDDTKGHRKNLLTKLFLNYESGLGYKPGTWWGAYNAVTQMLSHDVYAKKDGKRSNVDTRLDSLLFGVKARMSHRALVFAAENSGVDWKSLKLVV